MAENNVTVSGGEAQCVGDQIVEIVEAQTLADAGVTPEEIREDTANLSEAIGDPTPEQADQLSDAIFDCLNVAEIFVAGFEQSAEAGRLFPLRGQGAMPGGELRAERGRCGT